MHPLAVSDHFVFTDYLYRKLTDGSAKAVNSLHGGQLVVTFAGEKIRAVDIVWALKYGNWPKYPLVQLDGDVWNLRLTNIMPARMRRLRFRCTEFRGGFMHSLARVPFSSLEKCRDDWAEKARDFYVKDLPRVLAIEDQERTMRSAHGEDTFKALPKYERKHTLKNSPHPTTKPPVVEGMAWHWVNAEWLSVPLPVHPSDDLFVRIEAFRQNKRMIYDPITDRCMPSAALA